MPTIAHINTTAGTGTVGLWLDALSSALETHGWTSAVIAGNGIKSPNHHIVMPFWRRYTNAFSHRINNNDGRYDTHTSARTIRLLQQLRPDIVHLHNLHGYYIDIISLCNFLTTTKIPVVITMHDAWLLTGRCATPGTCREWVTHKCGACEYPAKYPAVKPTRIRTCEPFNKAEAIGRLNAHIVCPSDSLAEMISRSGLAHLPLSIIRHGVDTGVFYPKESCVTDPTHIRIAAAGRIWNIDKGADLLMQFAERMPASWQLTVAGDFPKSLKPKWTRHSDKVVFTDRILTRPEVADLFRSSDISVVPSRGESFSLVASESAACNTPAILSSDASPRAYLPEGCGCYASFTNPDTIIDAIRKHVGRPIMTQNIRDINTMSGEYIRLYHQIISAQ